ncbi:queuosine precursor transporter [Methanolobus psychrotolerans]|uniref:queuosine precursor transporter n=1 Tax=Methanolobus psychrotolerans TaxID=1874706 RepID=UPI001F5D2C8E|nr:queuosine precursor transporter [Methanolobus psychrotolerans]
MSLTIVTYISAFIVNRYREYGFTVLVAFYTVYLAASQIVAARLIEFDLGFYTFFAPAAVFLYPFLSQAIDMINEVYGEKKAHIAILIAFITQVLLVIFIVMTNSLSPAPFFDYEDAWQSIFAQGIRIVIASWFSFLIFQNIDAYVFAWMKAHYPEKIFLRSAASDLLSLTLDSLVFVVLAFYGVAPLIPLITGQIVAKNLIGLLDTPWFVWYKKYLEKNASGRDN